MSFENQLSAVIEIERLGKARLDEARVEAERLIESARDRARRIGQEGESSIAQQRRERAEAFDAETERLVAEIEQQGCLEQKRIQPLAAGNRDQAVAFILSWLWGEA